MAGKDRPKVVEPGKELSPEAKARQEEALKKKDSAVILTIEDQPVLDTPVSTEQPKTKQKTSYYQRRKKREKESAEGAATVLIMLLDSMVGASFGDECRMIEHEKAMILEPLGRMMARLDYAKTQLVEKWTDPILLSMGAAAWIGRVYRIQADKRDDDDGGSDDDVKPVIPPDNVREKEKFVPSKDNIAFVNDTISRIIGGDEGITA